MRSSWPDGIFGRMTNRNFKGGQDHAPYLMIVVPSPPSAAHQHACHAISFVQLPTYPRQVRRHSTETRFPILRPWSPLHPITVDQKSHVTSVRHQSSPNCVTRQVRMLSVDEPLSSRLVPLRYRGRPPGLSVDISSSASSFAFLSPCPRPPPFSSATHGCAITVKISSRCAVGGSEAAWQHQTSCGGVWESGQESKVNCDESMILRVWC